MIRTLVFGILVLAAVALAVAFVAMLKLYRIPSASMEPTLRCARPAPGCTADTSDRVAAIRVEWPFESVDRGDIVAFRTPELARQRCGAGGTFVARIVALPGETWAQRSGLVFVDGRRLEEPYVEDRRRDRETYRPRRVPLGHYFVQGDNRGQSCDSRIWGPLPERNLVAKAVLTYWPPGRIAVR
ncbi:MAG: signal peptidase I [Actinomycetota bacterium]|nr:signal peptidase I [Actinomycetota bacterium]